MTPAYSHYFCNNFDDIFCTHLDGIIHTALLDFKFKPSMILTGEMWFSELIQGCESFKELVQKETTFGKAE